MPETLLTAVLLAVLTGVVPGPYTTVVAGTAVERGLRPALRLAFVPLVTDVPPMVVTTLLLDRVSGAVLTGVGIAGGLLLGWLGIRFLRRNGAGWLEEDGDDPEQSARFGHLVAAGLLSPAPWLFWLVAASPLLLRAWREGTLHAVVFVLVFFTVLIATTAAIAWAASRGRSLLDLTGRKRVLQGAGAALVILGGVLVWQSVTGNFQSMVERQEEIRERVD